jgi:hypothetical protein
VIDPVERSEQIILRLEERIRALEAENDRLAADKWLAEHADRVWLTRDEAREVMAWLDVLSLDHAEVVELIALLDERIGDKA